MTGGALDSFAVFLGCVVIVFFSDREFFVNIYHVVVVAIFAVGAGNEWLAAADGATVGVAKTVITSHIF